MAVSRDLDIEANMLSCSQMIDKMNRQYYNFSITIKRKGFFMRILIADDEKMTRDSLVRLIDWKSLGVDEVLPVEDGEEALEVAKMYPPDLLLSDIKMPRMDGIELARRVVQLYPWCQIAFLSGYSDKEYLMSAIEMNIGAYLEKPIDPAAVTAAMKKLIEKTPEKQKNLQRYTRMRDMVRSEMIMSLINGDIDHAIRSAHSIEMNLENSMWQSVVLTSATETINHDMVEQFMKDYQASFCFCLYADALCTISLPMINPERCLEDSIAEERDISMGISKDYLGAKGAAQAITEAIDAAVRARFYGIKKVYYEPPVTNLYFREDDEKLLENFSLHNVDDARKTVDLFFKRLCKDINVPVPVTRDRVNYLACMIADDAAHYNVTLKDMPMNEYAVRRWLMGKRTLEQCQCAIMKEISCFEGAAEHNESSSFVDKALNYIQEHVGDADLSLERICAHIHMSQAYFCSQFKKTTGSTVGVCITKAKIDKAKELLNDRSLKVKDVAGMVGYSDSDWFVRRFKQIAGVTPSEYRKRH